MIDRDRFVDACVKDVIEGLRDEDSTDACGIAGAISAEIMFEVSRRLAPGIRVAFLASVSHIMETALRVCAALEEGR